MSAYNDVIAKSAKTASDTDPFFRPFVSDGALLLVIQELEGLKLILLVRSGVWTQTL